MGRTKSPRFHPYEAIPVCDERRIRPFGAVRDLRLDIVIVPRLSDWERSDRSAVNSGAEVPEGGSQVEAYGLRRCGGVLAQSWGRIKGRGCGAV